MNDMVTHDGEVLSTGMPTLPPDMERQTSLAVALARAEVDQQIATARALPRGISRVSQNILGLATIDDQTAEECVYALPRGGKPIRGPSIRFAEIISSQWGNCRVGARVVHVDRVEKYVEAEGVFHDLETNTATTARVRRRIVDSRGRLYNDDMIVMTGNAACSIAKRNAILGGVPKAVWRKAAEAVDKVIAGDIATLAERREKAFKAFAAFGVKPDQIYAALAIGGVEDITLEHMATLTAMHAALKNNEATVEEMFPAAPAARASGPESVEAKLDSIAGAEPKQASAGEQKKSETNKESPEGSPTPEPKAKPAEKTPSSAGETGATGRAPEAKAEAPESPPDKDTSANAAKQEKQESEPGDVNTARARGAKARSAGMSRKATPPEFRQAGREAELEAYLEGFDSGEAEG